MTWARVRGLVRVVLAIGALAACGKTPTAPSQEGPLRLTGQTSRAVIARGDTATVTFRLQNVTSDVITLSFGSSCQIMPYISSGPDGPVVYPQGGGWGCLAVVTELVLPPGGSVLREVHVRAGGPAAYPHVALPAGEYLAFARLEDSFYRLQSEVVSFRVQ